MSILQGGNNNNNNNSNKEPKHEIDKYKATYTQPSNTFQPFQASKTYHGYDSSKEKNVRVGIETRNKLKALAQMGVFGTNMKECIENILDNTLSGFDNGNRAVFEDNLNRIRQFERNKNKFKGGN